MAIIPVTGPAGPTLKAFWIITIPKPRTNDPKNPILNNSTSNSIYLVPNHKTSPISKVTKLRLPIDDNVNLVGLNPILSDVRFLTSIVLTVVDTGHNIPTKIGIHTGRTAVMNWLSFAFPSYIDLSIPIRTVHNVIATKPM